MTQPTGRRERKKARTRQALADTALELFLEHGYDRVGVRDVAEAADVSATTLFKHFPCKEALVFDLDDHVESALTLAVQDRGPGRSIPDALRDHLIARIRALLDDPRAPATWAMVAATPALRDYARRMWLRHEDALTAAIARQTGADDHDFACRALAHFALEAIGLALHRPDPADSLTIIFDLLGEGWNRSDR